MIVGYSLWVLVLLQEFANNRLDMDYVRLYEKHHLVDLLKLNEKFVEDFVDYPYHSNWMEKAREDIVLGKRIAFGAYYGDELVGSVIVKDGLSSDLELKNFLVNSKHPEVEILEVRDKLLKQVEVFAQRNSYEIFTTDILTNHLDELNYFLNKKFKVSYLKQFPYQGAKNIYTLTKNLSTIYNGDPLDSKSIIHWILQKLYGFLITDFKRIDCHYEPQASCYKYNFKFSNRIESEKFLITGEAIAIDFIEEVKIPRLEFEQKMSSCFNETSDVKLCFTMNSINKINSPNERTNMESMKTHFFYRKDLFNLLGKDSIPAKIPFKKDELGGILFYMDDKIKEMFFTNPTPKLFDTDAFRLYLFDGYGESLSPECTVFFVDKNSENILNVYGKAEIKFTYTGNYNEIYQDLRILKKDIEEENDFNFFEDRYDKDYWNFCTYFHRTSKNRYSRTSLITALALGNFVKKKSPANVLDVVSKSTRNYIELDQKETFTKATYLDKNSVTSIKSKYFKINDIIPTDNTGDSSVLKFSNSKRRKPKQ